MDLLGVEETKLSYTHCDVPCSAKAVGYEYRNVRECMHGTAKVTAAVLIRILLLYT